VRSSLAGGAKHRDFTGNHGVFLTFVPLLNCYSLSIWQPVEGIAAHPIHTSISVIQGMHTLNVYLTQNGVPIIPNPSRIGGTHCQFPLPLAIQIHRINEKILDLYVGGWNECTGVDLMLDLNLTLLRFLLGLKRFPFLLGITVCVIMAKNCIEIIL